MADSKLTAYREDLLALEKCMTVAIVNNSGGAVRVDGNRYMNPKCMGLMDKRYRIGRRINVIMHWQSMEPRHQLKYALTIENV